MRTKKKISTDPLFLNALVRLQVNKYIDGLKDAYQRGYVKVRGVNCGSFEMSHEVDFLIYILIKKKGITKGKLKD